MLLVAGVFVGSSSWWLLLSRSAARLAGQLSARAVWWMQRASGVCVLAIGASLLTR
jgi:hypothetical protein